MPPVSDRSKFSYRSYKLIDLLMIIVSLFIASSLYSVPLTKNYLIVLLLILFCFFYLAEGAELYRSWRAGKFTSILLIITFSLTASFACLFIFSFLFKFSESLSRIVIMLWYCLSLISLFSFRIAIRSYKVRRFNKGLGQEKVAIIGFTAAGIKLAEEILKHKEVGFELCGFYEDRAAERLLTGNPSTIIGDCSDAIKSAKSGEITKLYIALPAEAKKRIESILLELGDSTVDVYLVPDMMLSNIAHARIDHVGEIDVLSVFESPYFGFQRVFKRLEDVVLSALIILLISPVLVCVALAVKLTSRGPVIFKQDRYGLSGQKISVYKFRSMTTMDNSGDVKQATKNDVRITAVGKFIRRTSLDELPQFFNALKGDMSIVGPRPHAVSHNEEYRSKVNFYMLRHKVKPGITGWAQINGWRGETDELYKMEKRVDFDLYYIKNWTILFDIKIILLTVFKGFVDKNAY